MRDMVFLLLAAAGLAYWYGAANDLSGPVTETRLKLKAEEIRVIDGDTVAYKDRRIRLMGLDTPEIRFAKCDAERRRGEDAKRLLTELIKEAGTVTLILDKRTDKYERGLGHIQVGGLDLGAILVAARVARRYDGGQREGWCDGETQ